LLCQEEKQIWLLDARALLTEVNKRRLTEAFTEGVLKSRPLLLPQRLSFDQATLEKISKFSDQITRFGFELTETGDGHVLLRTAPMLLQTAASDVILYSLIENLGDSDDVVLLKLAESAAQGSPLSSNGIALREWLSIQFNLLGDLSKTVAWARLLDAETLQTWLDEK